MSVVSATRKPFTLISGFFHGRMKRASLNVSPRISMRPTTHPNLQQSFVGTQGLLSTCAQPLSLSARPAEKVTVHFISHEGKRTSASGCSGDTLLDVVVKQKLEFSGFGACEGTLACTTCHLILEQEVFDQLGDVAEEELDVLDLAYGLTDTSRLGCQICLTKDLEGITLHVPAAVNNMRRIDDADSIKSP